MTEYEHPTPSDTEEFETSLPKCELCDTQWYDPTLPIEEEDSYETIKFQGRCVGCLEEYGEDGYPDR